MPMVNDEMCVLNHIRQCKHGKNITGVKCYLNSSDYQSIVKCVCMKISSNNFIIIAALILDIFIYDL